MGRYFDEDDWKEMICDEIIQEIEAGEYPFEQEGIKGVILEKITQKYDQEEIEESVKDFLEANVDEMSEYIAQTLHTDLADEGYAE